MLNSHIVEHSHFSLGVQNMSASTLVNLDSSTDWQWVGGVVQLQLCSSTAPASLPGSPPALCAGTNRFPSREMVAVMESVFRELAPSIFREKIGHVLLSTLCINICEVTKYISWILGGLSTHMSQLITGNSEFKVSCALADGELSKQTNSGNLFKKYWINLHNIFQNHLICLQHEKI